MNYNLRQCFYTEKEHAECAEEKRQGRGASGEGGVRGDAGEQGANELLQPHLSIAVKYIKNVNMTHNYRS